MDPKDYDVLLTDITDTALRSDIAELAGVAYLEKATIDEANTKVDIGYGFLYGSKFRPVFPCIVRSKNKAHWVFFIVDSGAPVTYLSSRVSVATYRKNSSLLTLTLGGRRSRYPQGPYGCYDCRN